MEWLTNNPVLFGFVCFCVWPFVAMMGGVWWGRTTARRGRPRFQLPMKWDDIGGNEDD